MSRGVVRAKDVIVDDALDRIYKAWLSHRIDDLSLRDQYLLERMEYADAKLREGGEASRYTNLVNDMLEKFKHQGVGDIENTNKEGYLTKRTIETDIARAKQFFLSARPREDKEYARGKSIEWLERLIWKAEDAGEYKAAAAFMKELSDIQGFKKQDIDLPDYDAIQPPPVMIVVNPVEIGVPEIPNLAEELRLLLAPKARLRNNDSLDAKDAEVVDGNE